MFSSSSCQNKFIFKLHLVRALRNFLLISPIDKNRASTARVEAISWNYLQENCCVHISSSFTQRRFMFYRAKSWKIIAVDMVKIPSFIKFSACATEMAKIAFCGACEIENFPSRTTLAWKSLLTRYVQNSHHHNHSHFMVMMISLIQSALLILFYFFLKNDEMREHDVRWWQYEEDEKVSAL